MIMMFDLSFTHFNLLEGTFWVACAAIAFFIRRRVRFLPVTFRYLLSLSFILFGMSDFVEVYYPISFLDHGGEWLFVWKLLCIAGFISCFFWYLKIRFRKK